ncbi:MAG: metallopeptidase family protein [Acidobacteria bacterium]|nr:metallopeptidase family protein [Acidobacteriota bacterium]
MIESRDRDVFEQQIEQVIARLPERFREAARNIQIIVEEEPSPELLAGDDSDEPLLGLYVGTPLPDRSFGEVPALPDRIYIFRGPLERMSRSRKELREQIRITVLHELAHYFGLDDDRLLALGYD